MPARPLENALLAAGAMLLAASSENRMEDGEKNENLALIGVALIAAGSVNRRTQGIGIGRSVLYDPLESDNRLRLMLARRRRRKVLVAACALDLLARAQRAQRSPSLYRQLTDETPMDAEAIMARESHENFLLYFCFTKSQFMTLCDQLRVPAFFHCGAEDKMYVGLCPLPTLPHAFI